MRFFGLFSRSPKPRVQSSSLCAPAKTKSRHSAAFLFSYGDPAKASVFSHGKRIGGAMRRVSRLCPCQIKKSVNPLVSRVCGLFYINFRERSRCTKQHKTTYKNKKKVVKRLSEVFAGKKTGAFLPRAIPLAISGILWYAINVYLL